MAELPSSISVTAETLDWNIEEPHLISLDTVEIHSPSIGTFTSSEKWTLQEEKGTFVALGSTTFSGIDGLQLTCTGCLEYDPKTESIRAHASTSPLSVEKNGLCFTATAGELQYHDLQIETFTFSNSAKLKMENLTASLEAIRFDKSSHSLFLFSKEGAIPLSYKELSFPLQVEKVQIIKDPSSSTISLKGIGRVHFTIDETQVDQLLDGVNQCIKSLY
jgi:hypothetical protein